ncbi:hypothetical protein JCM10212_004390 [Sporobolomyces blumeae]
MSLSSTLRFASFRIPNQVFYQSPLCVGIVNLKPLVPGHVLVIPKRVVQRFRDLTGDEVSDLFKSVHHISRVIETEYKAQALNVALQDGPLAGQSVPHVHVHIIPRRAKDFEPLDEMYNALDAKDLDLEFRERYEARPFRSVRKQAEADAQAEAEAAAHARAQFEADRIAKRMGNVEVPFVGIEDDAFGSGATNEEGGGGGGQEPKRRERGANEMRQEAERLNGLFPEENRVEFEPEEDALEEAERIPNQGDK